MFAKIFTQIFHSSLADDIKLRHFFMDLLVLADPNGVVDMTPTSIACITREILPNVQQYLDILEKPDPRSRSREEAGARIRRLFEDRDWGWEIVNYTRYREMASEEQRRERTKRRTRKWRDKNEVAPMSNNCDAPVTHCDAFPSASASACTSQEGGMGETEIELPKGFPQTAEAAMALAETVGCPKEFVVGVWNKAYSRGGRDAKGNPIKSFRHYLAIEKVYEQERLAREQRSGAGNKQKPYAQNNTTNAEMDRLLKVAKSL